VTTASRTAVEFTPIGDEDSFLHARTTIRLTT
jgi:hypothetical protein